MNGINELLDYWVIMWDCLKAAETELHVMFSVFGLDNRGEDIIGIDVTLIHTLELKHAYTLVLPSNLTTVYNICTCVDRVYL